MRVTWVAYVDESMRVSADSPTSRYVLAAAVMEIQRLDVIRPTVAGLARSGPRFHWRRESPKVQRRAVETVAGLPALHLVVIGTPLDGRRQERGRRQCLERLLYELDAADVAQVWLEARTPQLNRRDLQLVDALRTRQTIRRQLRIDHARPLGEPLLWLADLIAGAYCAVDSQHRAILRERLLCGVCRVDLT